ncbi:hypothetical protein DDZ16_16380 [Marinilabilia rubra]|uniref:DUF1460 domain-containing protein n=2 Tax=Marinilabilia rubra TaxID=2162893 RepID=A0A2U2B5D2_9BACT|nr:hypothetical protein DDZ16_16380 [Marinilabilia rubra]
MLSCSSSGKKKQEDDRSHLKTAKEPKGVVFLNPVDSLRLREVYQYSESLNLSDSLLSSVISHVALHFRGIPYVANTLEQEGEEKMVINLREFDCTTFVENVLAIANCIKEDNMHFECFLNRLTEIRYRKGIIDQYPSRLHYFSEWLGDNNAKGLLKIVSNVNQGLKA